MRFGRPEMFYCYKLSHVKLFLIQSNGRYFAEIQFAEKAFMRCLNTCKFTMAFLEVAMLRFWHDYKKSERADFLYQNLQVF